MKKFFAKFESLGFNGFAEKTIKNFLAIRLSLLHSMAQGIKYVCTLRNCVPQNSKLKLLVN